MRPSSRTLAPVEEQWPDYPWQLGFPPWAPGAGAASEAERRRRLCGTLFELEEAFREGGSPDPVLVYDAEGDHYRFGDGRFALSRERADWRGLKEIGYFSAWGM